MLTGFKPTLPARLVNAPLFERAEWHDAQAHSHREEALTTKNERRSGLHEEAARYHEDWSEYWGEMYQEVEEAISNARSEYEANTPQT